jgi:hypothetical protein
VNKGEAMKSLKSGGKLTVLVTVVSGILMSLAMDFHLWYEGPWKETLTLLVGAAVALLGTRFSLNRYAESGPDLDRFLSEENQILFSEDDETNG